VAGDAEPGLLPGADTCLLQLPLLRLPSVAVVLAR
jgi:hypothetical protein